MWCTICNTHATNKFSHHFTRDVNYRAWFYLGQFCHELKMKTYNIPKKSVLMLQMNDCRPECVDHKVLCWVHDSTTFSKCGYHSQHFSISKIISNVFYSFLFSQGMETHHPIWLPQKRHWLHLMRRSQNPWAWRDSDPTLSYREQRLGQRWELCMIKQTHQILCPVQRQGIYPTVYPVAHPLTGNIGEHPLPPPPPPPPPTPLLTFSLPRVNNFKFLLQSHQKYCNTQYEELGFS